VAADVCSNAYVAALTEHRRIAPAYADKATCDADFAADWCRKTLTAASCPNSAVSRYRRTARPRRT
jgi:uncharacterized protein YgiB involved in biofilm formation